MKKGLFLIPAAALALASCSNDDFYNDANNGLTGETETRYLAVNLVDVADGTRAGADYEEGIGNENGVKNIRFYLFGSTPYANTHYDCAAENDGSDMNNVEKKLKAVIVYEEPKNSPKPVKIVAVVNPPAGLADSYDYPEALQAVVDTYNVTSSASDFIMTNAVYVDETEHVAYDITTSYDSREEALANPVSIHVERVVAKARVKTASTLTKVAGKEYYNIQEKKNPASPQVGTIKAQVFENGRLTEKEIYLNLLGWNVTGTASQSRLVKKVNASWNFANWTDWNNSGLYRSFWAQNPTEVASQTGLVFGDFNMTGTTKANANNDFTAATPVYMQENAAWKADGKNPEYATKLIVAAQLVDNNNVGIDLAWWKGTYYLESSLLQAMATESKIYYKTGDASTIQTYEPLPSTMLGFKSNTDVSGGASRNYFSFAQLNDDANIEQIEDQNVTWYTKSNTGEYEAIEGENLKAAINNILKGLGETKVWHGGNTYYWTDIAHLGNNDYGKVGIVRNHIYDFELSSFVGFGIPVLNPSDVIYPEEPDDPDYAYIAAKLNILSWRVVYHDNTQLGWD